MNTNYSYFRFYNKIDSIKFYATIFFISISIGALSQSTIYVNSISGDDTTGDGNSGSPYQTFHKGYTMSASGDTIDLSGTFTWSDTNETGDTANIGYTISKNLTIQGQGPGNTIVQAESTPNTSDRRVFNISNGRTVKFENLKIRHGRGYEGPAGTFYGGAIGSVYGSTNTVSLSLENVTISENYSPLYATAGVYCEGSFSAINCTFQNNTKVDSGGSLALQLEYTGGTTKPRNIVNCTFFNNTSTDVNTPTVFIDRKGANFMNCTFIGNTNGIYAYALKENSDELYIVNCILADSGDYDIYHYARFSNYLNGIKCINSIVEEARSDYDTVNYTNSIVGNQVNLNIQIPTTNNGNNLKTPYLEIASNSVAVNAGTTGSFGSTYSGGSIAVPLTDQLGAARSGNVDIGSFEYGGTLTSTKKSIISTVKLFPTTTNGIINISDANTYEFFVYNMLGQEIVAGKGRRKIDISNNAKGMYVIKLKDENFERTFKVVLK